MEPEQGFITAGELGRLSQSTKRTVLWYSKMGLIKPAKINSKGYRFYTYEQMIDFQVIMLLRSLNFSLDEIKNFLKHSSSVKEIFEQKEAAVQKEIERLQLVTKQIKNYYTSFDQNKTLITPEIKQTKPFEFYYLEKQGPYAKIYDYLKELRSYFSKIPTDAIYLAMFLTDKYAPKKDHFRVGVVITPEMKLKPEAQNIVHKQTVPSFKSMSYTHIGSPALISMLWMQLQQYRENQGIKKNRNLGFHTFEFYIKTAMNDFEDDNQMISELNLPIL